MKSDIKIDYPIRINRYLYLTGICSRRTADKLIQSGEVHINNKVAVLGQQVQKNDKVTLGKNAKNITNTYKYYIYNKPVGIVSTNPQQSEISAIQDAKLSSQYAPVGRLDKASEGLMLLTNDGRIVNKILNPEFAHERQYIVKTNKPIKNNDIKTLSKGVNIEGYITKPAQVTKLGEKTIQINLTEGKKHQIRRMLAALGYTVTLLKRIAIMHLSIDDLAVGQVRELTTEELNELLEKIGMLK